MRGAADRQWIRIRGRTRPIRYSDIGACGYLRERGAPLRPALNDRSFKFSTRVTRSHHVPGGHEICAQGNPIRPTPTNPIRVTLGALAAP